MAHSKVQFINALVEKGCPFVVYKRPGQASATAIIDNGTPCAFPFHLFPFDGSAESLSIQRSLTLDEDLFHPHWLRAIAKRENPRLKPSAKQMNQAAYVDYVNAIKKYIAEGKAKKMVAARIEKVSYKHGFTPGEWFFRMAERYTTAFTYLLYHPKAGYWAGASPERLIIQEDNLLKTIALAGTRKHSLEPKEWGQKEKYEQAVVTEFISQTIIENGGSITQKQGPYTKTAGSIEHLATNLVFQPNGKSTLQWAKHLHPTPAVAGLPRKTAISFINQNEANRGLYTGFLGMQVDKHHAFYYVNLRCMQLFKDFAYLYLGAGITQDSNATDEWRETQNKSKTMYSILNP